MNINSITFISKCSVITANLNTSTSQTILVVPKKVDSGGEGNIMAFHILKNHSLGPQKKTKATKYTNINLRAYNSTTITQLSGCTVRIENNTDKYLFIYK